MITQEKEILKEKNSEVIIGSPGCGKTTELLNIIEKAMADGCHINQIGFVTFSVAGIEEALERVNKKFSVSARSCAYFKTLHAMAYFLLGLNRASTFDYVKQNEFANLCNLTLSFKGDIDSDGFVTPDDRIMHVLNLAKLDGDTLEETIRKYKLQGKIDLPKAKRIENDLETFKFQHQLFDYTDMIISAVEEEIPLPKLRYLIVDEAQDLSRLQWRFVFKLAQNAENIIIAGDDKQCINTFAGADLKTFLNLGIPIKVLPQSYRIPKKVHNYAVKILGKIKDKYDVEWFPREGEEGSVTRSNILPLDKILETPDEEWLILARNKSFLNEVAIRLFARKIPFTICKKLPFDPTIFKAIELFTEYSNTPDDEKNLDEKELKLLRKFISRDNFDGGLRSNYWYTAFSRVPIHCRDYVKELVKDGVTKINKSKIKVRLNTIHGSKGTEADNVVIINQYSQAVADEMDNNPEGEWRVIFVGVTRTKKNLYIVEGATGNRYDI